MREKTAIARTERLAALLLALVLALSFLLPVSAHARETGKTVRVG